MQFGQQTNHIIHLFLVIFVTSSQRFAGRSEDVVSDEVGEVGVGDAAQVTVQYEGAFEDKRVGDGEQGTGAVAGLQDDREGLAEVADVLELV